MDIRTLSPDFAVAPQIDADDVAELAALGFTHVICNRPAFESAPDQQPDLIRAAVEAAGLGWSDNPMAGGQLSMELVEAQRAPLADGGKVLAYCASGTRSAVLWGLSQAGDLGTDDILGAMAAAGYPMEQLRGQIDALASQRAAS